MSPPGVTFETLLTGKPVARVIAAAITPGPTVCPAPPGAVIVTVSPANALLARERETAAVIKNFFIVDLTLFQNFKTRRRLTT